MEAILGVIESLIGGTIDFEALLGGIDLEAIKGVLLWAPLPVMRTHMALSVHRR